MNAQFSLLLQFLPAILGANLLNKITPEENEEIQRKCENEDFTGGNGNLNGLMMGMDNGLTSSIIGGDPVPRAHYPWVAALYFGTVGNEVGNAPFCGGTIISQRHIITARHCVQKMICAEERVGTAANWWIQVGGVCANVNEEQNCPVMDMQKIPLNRAVYSSDGLVPCAGGASNIPTMVTDFAIIELAQDLEVAPTRIQVGCLPTQAIYADSLHIYGWGFMERNKKTAEESKGAAHLTEIELPVVDENDPKHEWDICQTKKLVCAHSDEPDNQKDGATGDSGTGIVGIHSGRPMLEAITITGFPGTKLNIGLLLFPLLREICSQTGICQKKAWGNGDDVVNANQMGSNPEEDGQTLLNMDMQYEYKGKPIP